jgi:hypothetical protein
MTYEEQILKILSEVGDAGISVTMLAKNIYNMNCSLFSCPDYTDVYQAVQQYLLRNSKSSQSLVEHTDKRGYYRLNTRNSADARQLMIDFSAQENVLDEIEEERPQVDLSLSLFDDFE